MHSKSALTAYTKEVKKSSNALGSCDDISLVDLAVGAQLNSPKRRAETHTKMEVDAAISFVYVPAI